MKTTTDNPSSGATGAVLPAGEPLRPFEASPSLFARMWRWLRSYQVGGNNPRRLQVADTVSLGEKRFVAVVQVDGRHFLVAGGPTNIALLAQLNDKDNFEDVLKKTMTVPEAPAPQQAEATVRKRASRTRRATAPVAVAPKQQAKPAIAKAKKKPAPVVAKQAKSAHAKAAQTKAAHATATQTAATQTRATQTRATQTGSRKQPSQESRFGDIAGAPRYGTRAFEVWLKRAVPVAQARAEADRKDAQSRNRPVAEAAGSTAAAPKQSLHVWLQEARNLAEKAPSQPISEPIPMPIAKPSVEEYA